MATEENKKTYIPKIFYNNELLEYKETPLIVKETELCPHCKEDITIEQIKHIEPNVNEALAKKILKYLNKYKEDYKLDTCLRKAHFIAQCLVESNKFKTLKEYMSYSPKSIKKYYKESEHIKLTDSNIETYKDEIKIIDTRKEEDKKKDKDKKDKYAELDKLNPAYIHGNTRKKKYQETIYLNEDKTIALKVLSHSHNEKEIANRKYSDRSDIGNKGGDDGYSFLGRGIIQLTGRDAYTKFSTYRKNNTFKDDSSGYIDFTKEGNFKKIENQNNPIYAVQSAVWFWDIYKNYAKVEDKCDEDDIKKVTKMTNGGTSHLKERNKYIIKAREDNGLKVFKHYKEVHKNGSKEQKEEVVTLLRKISQDNFAYDSLHKKKVNLKDSNAETLLKELTKVEAIELKPKGIKSIPFEIDTNLKLTPINNQDN